MRRLLALLALLAMPGRAAPPDALDFRDGDRVVLLGGMFVEREPSHGELETAWTAAHPDRTVTFRNLGWSGDTVGGLSRARFGPPEEGFQHLREHVLALKPTVLIVSYGANEAFEGEAGLPAFRAGLSRLLDTLAEAKARIVLLSPPRNEALGPPLPDPAAHNAAMGLYRDALRDAARERSLGFVDLLATGFPGGTPTEPPCPATDDGVCLNAYGYWKLPEVLGLLPDPPWRVTVSARGDDTLSVGSRVSEVAASPREVRFQALDTRLPRTPAPAGTPPERVPPDRILKVVGLEPGRYGLSIDGAECVQATARQWAEGVALAEVPERAHAEALRRTIVRKNLLYFHRWRPQNETYLFGFRKHEQGQNAREIPLFDPLVAEQEARIAQRKLPVAHQYALKPLTEAAR